MSDYQECIVRVYPNGTKKWYQNGKLHREDGPAVEYADGSKSWYQNGKLHRLDGPAVEYPDGYKSWYQNGKYHRLDGPAVEYADGSKEWYIEGLYYTEEEFSKLEFNSKLKSILEYVHLELESAAETHSCKSCENAAIAVADFMERYPNFFESDS